MRQRSLLCLIWLSSGVSASSQTAEEIQRVIRGLGNNSTALATTKAASWVDAPTVRGSTDILWTCIVTLFACVYTALHLNVPAKSGLWASICNKLRWVVVAILAPETVLVLAVIQFLEARALKRKLDELRAGDPKIPNFDLQFCFFVVMKGLQIPIDDIQPGPDFQVSGATAYPSPLPLSSKGFLKLVEMGEVDGESMMNSLRLGDRSKANTFQKALVLMQVAWMALQCIVRKTQGLPISLLEVHILVHVVCTVFIYLFWLHKPLDIGFPEVIPLESESLRGFAALAVQSQLCGDWIEKNLVLYATMPRVVVEGNVDEKGLGSVEVRQVEPLITATSTEGQQYEPYTPRVSISDNKARWVERSQAAEGLRSGEALPCGAGLLMSAPGEQEVILSFTPSDLLRVERATSFRQSSVELQAKDMDTLYHTSYDKYLSEIGNVDMALHDRYNSSLLGKFGDAVLLGTSLWSLMIRGNKSVSLIAGSRRPLIAATVLTGIYGGIHSVAWHFMFPTVVESLLWKISALISCTVIPASLLVVGLLSSLAGKVLSGSRHGYLPPLVLSIFVVANISARLFLTVESFASIRGLPVGAYSIPAWLQMLPHL